MANTTTVQGTIASGTVDSTLKRFALYVTAVTDGPSEILGQTIIIETTPNTEILWVGSDDLLATTRIEVEVRAQADGDVHTYVADTVRVDNSIWKPFRR